MAFELRDYQRLAVDNVEAELAFGSNKVIVSLCTGGGKSLIISTLCKENEGEKIIVLTNISKLIGQISEHLTAVGVSHSILKAGMEDKFDSSERVQLVMEQTLQARDIDIEADIIIRDEGHIGVSGDRYKNIVKSSGAISEVLFSATPYDNFGTAIPGYEIIEGLNTAQATKRGYLTPANTYIAKFTKDVDLSDIGASGDYSANELDGVINNESYNVSVVEAYKKLPVQEKARRTICFVSGIDHCDDLASKFSELGVRAKSVHSKNTEIATFSNDGLIPEDDYEVIISVSKLSTGFDDTSIDTVINCRPTLVKSLYYQMIGRALRLHKGQSTVDILDCAKATAQHGFYDQVYLPMPDRKAAKKFQESMKLDVIDYVIGQNDTEECVRVTLDGVEAIQSTLESDNSIEGLKARFELCTDIRELIDLLDQIAKLVSPHKFSKSFVSAELINYVDDGGSFKAIKTRSNNILKKGGKLNALKFFPSWLLEQRWS